MKNIAAILLLLTLFLKDARAQDFGVELGIGVATSQMDDLKYLQDYLMVHFPIPGEITSSFPAYTLISVGVVKQLNRPIRIGGLYAHTSTGGRANYTDYSGNYDIEITAISSRIGAILSYTILYGNQYTLAGYGQLGANISRVEVEESVHLRYGSDWHTDKYKAINPCGSAGLELMFDLNLVSLGISGGYQVDLLRDLEYKESGNVFDKPLYQGDRELKADWTGWRARAKIIFWVGN